MQLKNPLSILMRKSVIQIRQACLSTKFFTQEKSLGADSLCYAIFTWYIADYYALKLLGSISQNAVFNYCISFYKGRNHLLSLPLSTQLLTLDLTYNLLLKAWIKYYLCVWKVRVWVMTSHMQSVSISSPLISRVQGLLTSSNKHPGLSPYHLSPELTKS